MGLPAFLFLGFLVRPPLVDELSVHSGHCPGAIFAVNPLPHEWTDAQAAQVWRAKPSLRKLQRSNSHIMTTYYSWMWVVGLLGVVRSVMQMAEASAPHPGLYNVVWLVTRFGEGSLSARRL